MSKTFMTTQERAIVNSILNCFNHKFWEYGDKEACFKDDVELMVLIGVRNKEIK